MTFDQIRYFVVVSRLGHMGQAAKSLRLSTSAVSHSLTALEESVGFPLYRRVGRRLTLTAQGKAFLTRCESLLANLDTLTDGLTAGEQPQYLVCGGPPSLIGMALSPILGKLAKRFSQLEVTLNYVPSANIEEKIRTGELNLGLMYLDGRKPKVPYTLISSEPAYFCTRPNHPIFSVASAKRIKELARYPMVSPQPREALLKGSDPMVKAIVKGGAKVAYLVPSYDIGARIVGETDAWGIFPSWVLSVFDGPITRLTPKPACRDSPVACLYSKELAATPLLDELVLNLKMTLDRQ